MFRKRKTVSPFFRMPVPYSPVGGTDHPLDPPKKPYCRFVLTEALTKSDESAKAAILTAHQWGPGDYHCPDVIVHIHNLLSEDETTYVFELAEGGVGMALWDHANHWRMIGASTGTSLVELCAQGAAERNVPYDALLGTWNADENIWCYDDAAEVKAIDHRMGSPLADVGWKGLYQAMSSTDYGTIYICVSLDCEKPDEGCNECEEA